MANFNTNTDNEETWLTPPWLIRRLGPFDLDPCTIAERPWDTAATHYTKADNGLSHDWTPYPHIWLNPPYGDKTFRWLHRLSLHPGTGYALIFARTETKGFFEQVWHRAAAVFFFRGRIRFHRADGTEGDAPNAPSCLITYAPEGIDKLTALQQDGRGICLQLRAARYNPAAENQLTLFPLL